MVIGLAMGAATSCSMADTTNDIHLTTCEEGCEIDHRSENSGNNHHWDDCPACGMG